MKKSLGPLLALAFLAVGVVSVQATSWTFIGSDANFSWEDTTKWSPASVPNEAGGSARINNNNASLRNITFSTSPTIGTLLAGKGGGAYNTTRYWAFPAAATITLDNTGGSGKPTVGGLNSSWGYQIYHNIFDGNQGLNVGTNVIVHLAGNNTFTGDVDISSGGTILAVGHVNALPHGSRTGNINFLISGTTLALRNISITINGLNSVGAVGTVNSSLGSVVLTVGDNDQDGSYGGVIANGSGTVGLTKIGAGTQTLTGANTYSGATTISAGEINAGAANTLSPNSAINVNGGTLEIGTFSQSVGAVTLASGDISGSSGVLTGTSYGVQSGTVSAILGGAGRVLTKTTAGTVTLSGVNTYDGGTVINDGVLAIDADSNLGDSSGGVTLGGGTLRITTGGFSTSRAISLTEDSSLDNATGGSVTLAGGISKGGKDITFTGSGGTTFIGTAPITGAADVIVDGTTVQYDVAQTYDGPTIIRNGGTLTLGASSVMPSSPRSAVVLDDVGSGSSVFDANGFDDAVASLTGDATSTVSIGGTTLTIGGGSGTFAGAISGASAALVKDSGGTQTLTGTVPSDLDVTVSGGTLNIDATSHSVGPVTVTGGTLAGTSGVLTGTSYDLQGGSVSAILGGAGVTLTKNGSDTVTLSGVNTYSGDTTIAAGFLAGVAGGSAANSAATVADQATNGVVVTDNTLQWTWKSWTNASGGSQYLDFEFGAVTPSTTTAPLRVTDDFSIEGTLNILVHGVSFPDGTYPLVTNVGGTILGTVPGSTLNQIYSRTTTTLAKSGDDKSILMTTASASPITWQPTSGFWNTTDNNWKDKNATTTAYIESPFPDEVVFDDVPGANYAVTLDETVSPYSIMVSNSAYDAVISGSGKISGDAFFTKINSGTLTLGNDNDFTGGVTLGGGEIIVSSGASLAGATGALTITNGTLTLNNTAQTVGELTGGESAVVALGSGHTLTVNQSTDTAYDGVFNGAGGLTKSGPGTLTLSGSSANTASGLTEIEDGVLELNKSGVGAVAGDLTVSGTGTAVLLAADQIDDGATVTVSGGTLDMQGFDDTVGAVVMTGSSITGAGGTLSAATYGLSGGTVASGGQLGAGTLNVSGNVAMDGTAAAGTVNLTAGTLTLGAPERLNDTAGLFVSGGTLALGASDETVGAVSLTAGAITGTGGTLTGTSYDVEDGAVSANLAGAGVALTKNTTGTVTLSGVNTYDGGVTVNDGELTVNSGAALAAPDSSVAMAGGTLNLNNASERVASLSGSSSAVINLGATHTLIASQHVATTFSGVLAGAGSFQMNGDGTLTLDGDNTFSGSKTIGYNDLTGSRTGVVVLASAPNYPTSTSLGTSNNIFMWGGVLRYTAADNFDYSQWFNVGGNRFYRVDTAGQNITWAKAMSGGASILTKMGTGTLRLAGHNTYNGVTTVSEGTLIVGNTSNEGSISNSSVTLGSGTTLVFENGSGGNNHYPVPGGLPRISGDGEFIKRGSGTFRFNSTNSYTGNTTVEEGTLNCGTVNGIPGGPGKGNVTIMAGAAIQNGAGGFVANGLSGDGNINGGSPVTVYNENQDSTYSGNMTAGVLTKTGNGRFTLDGINTSPSSLVISNGTVELAASGSWAGPALIAAGGTLTGAGTNVGTVTVAGDVSPGTSPGTLNTGSEIWTGGGSYTWEINDATGTAGADPGWDLLSITGGLDVDATPENKFTINVTSLTTGNAPGDMDNFNNALTYEWVIAHVTDEITNFNANAFRVVSASVSNDLGSGVFTIGTNNSTNVFIGFEENVAPVLTVPADQTIFELTTLIVTNTATDANPGTAFNFTLLAAPAGMTIDSVTGVITWSPTADQGPSTNTVTVVVDDGAQTPLSDTNSFEVVVECAPITLSPSSPLVTGQKTSNYSETITASGSVPPHTFALISGTLPGGLTFDSGGLLSGVPTNIGLFNFTIEATSSNGCTGLQAYELVILPTLPDTNKPKVVITAPVDKTTVTTVPTNIVGTASDVPLATASGIHQVLFSVNGGPTNQVASGTTSWTAAANFVPGTNTFTAVAKDLAGNESLPVTRRYVLSATSSLLIVTNGLGTITPLATANGGAGTPGDGATLELNRAYTLNAAAGANYLFSNWLASVDGGPATVASTSAKYTFLMQTNLTLTVNFVTNRFIGAAGVYYGLFTDEDTPIVSHERSGLFTLKTDSKQKFSGKLFLDGAAVGFAGQLNLDGYGVSKKPSLRKGKSAVEVAVQLTFDGSDAVSGTVVALSNSPNTNVLYPTAFTSAMTGFRAGFNLTNNPATNLLGAYTMVVDVPTGDADDVPKGNGYATLTMSSNGLVKAVGYLGDYAPLKPVVVQVSKDGDWPLYAGAYKGILNYIDPKTSAEKVAKENNGMIMGWMKFTNHTGAPADRDLLEGSVHWIKTPNTNNFYPAGFTNHDLTVFASVYNAPTNVKTDRVLQMTNTAVEFTDGDLLESFTNYFDFRTNNKLFAVDIPNVNTQSVAVTPKTGVVKGKFYHPADPVTPLRVPVGVVLQDENIARGVFKGTNSSGSFLLRSVD